MSNPFRDRNVQLAAAICLPLVAIHYSDIADLGHFVFVPMITLAVLALIAATVSTPRQDSSNNG